MSLKSFANERIIIITKIRKVSESFGTSFAISRVLFQFVIWKSEARLIERKDRWLKAIALLFHHDVPSSIIATLLRTKTTITTEWKNLLTRAIAASIIVNL
jgi:hypothetical protein